MQTKVKPRSVALANQKGGVGKTTTAIHLAHGLSIAGKRVVLLDLDPQGNATVGVGAERGVSRKDSPLVDLPAGFALLPANVVGQPSHLERLIEEIKLQGFDWLVADCPPRMDEWGWAGVRSCSEVIVPVQAEFFAMQGLSQMLATLDGIRQASPDRSKLLGVLPTMVDLGLEVCREVLADLRQNLGDSMFQTPILRDSSVVEASSHGETLFQYSPRSCAALCFSELVHEVIHGRS